MTADRPPTPPPTRGSTLVTLGLSALTVAAGVALVVWIQATEPPPIREGATKKSAMLVEVVTPEVGDFSPTLSAMGRVRPSRDLVVRVQLGAEVREVAPQLRPGALVTKGQHLVTLDQRALDIALRRAQSELTQANAAVTLERAQRRVAQVELKRFGARVAQVDAGLVLRDPQRASAQAQAQLAKARIAAAQLDLSRAVVRAPFDALVMDRRVELGAVVQPGDAVTRLVGARTFWVEVAVPQREVARIELPEAAADAPVAWITSPGAWPAGSRRRGRVLTLLHELDPKSRLAPLLVAVDAPLSTEPRLTLGAYVHVALRAKRLTGVARIHRDLLRKGDTVWVMRPDATLDVRKVQVTFRDRTHVFIGQGLSASDRVVVTNLSRVAQGASLRVATAPRGPSP